MILLIAILLQGQAEPAGPPAERFVARADLWYAEPSGTAVDFQSVGLEDDLGLGYARGFLRVGIGFEFPTGEARDVRTTVELAYGAAQWSGEHVLGFDLDFDDASFPAGTEVDADFWLQVWELGARVEARPSESVRASVLLSMELVRTRVTIEDPGQNGHVTRGDLLMKAGGGLYWVPEPWIDLGGALEFGYGFLGSLYFQVEATVGVTWEGLRLDLGVRYLRFDGGSLDDFQVEFDLFGPFASLTLRV